MAFEEIARGQLVLETVIDDRQITAAATRAANNFNETFNRVQRQFATSTKAQQVGAVQSLSTAFQGLAKNATLSAEKVSAFQAITSKTTSIFNSISGAATGVALALTGLVAVTIKLGASFAKTAGDFQELKISLEAIISNSATAKTTADDFIGTLRKLSLESGRSSIDLANVGRQFLALGFSGEKTTEILTTFTKAAAFTGASNEQLRLALLGVSQIASKGAVAMEELRRQIAENLPGAIDLTLFFKKAGEQLGITATEARKLQEAGKLTAEVGIKALNDTILETIGNVNVFQLRARTLSGQIGILKEGFTQAVQDGFQPFVEETQKFFAQLTSGQPIFSQFTPQIERLGKVLGKSLVQIFQQLQPLIPQLVELFVNLTEVFAPLIVNIVKIGATFGRIVIPILVQVTNVLDTLFNGLGRVSDLFKDLASGVAVGGFVRLIGSLSGIFGRLSPALGETLVGFSSLAGPIGLAAAAIGLFSGTLKPFLQFLKDVAAQLGLMPNLVDDFKFSVNQASKLPEQLLGEKLSKALGVEDFKRDLNDLIKTVLTGGDELGVAAETAKNKVVDVTRNITQGLKVAIEGTNDVFDKVGDILKNFSDSLDKVVNAQNSVESAQKTLTSATKSLSDASKRVQDLEAKRTELLKDTARDVKEVADAEERLTRIRFKLRDLNEDEASIQEELNKLRTPASQEELAAADRSIEHAKIALNKALRDQEELTHKLNEEQTQSVNLAGLDLDQIRSKLANVRATLAAQRQTARITDDQTNIEEKQLEARLNVGDAQQALNEALAARTELEDRVKNNAIAIRENEEALLTLSVDRASALRDESEAQDNLNKLRAGDTSRAKELRDLEKDIASARDSQIEAAAKINEAEIALRDVKLEQRKIVAETTGDEKTINQILLDRISLNQQLLNQSPALANQILTQLFQLAANPDSVVGVNQLATLFLTSPNPLRDILKKLGVPLAEGSLITKPTFAQIGEQFKPELVLPLTKPDRVWQLLSRHLPKYPGAALAAQKAVSGTSHPVPSLRASNQSNSFISWREMPLTREQGDEIIRLLKLNGKSQITVEAPIQVTNPIPDENLLARKLSRNIEKSIEKALR